MNNNNEDFIKAQKEALLLLNDKLGKFDYIGAFFFMRVPDKDGNLSAVIIDSSGKEDISFNNFPVKLFISYLSIVFVANGVPKESVKKAFNNEFIDFAIDEAYNSNIDYGPDINKLC